MESVGQGTGDQTEQTDQTVIAEEEEDNQRSVIRLQRKVELVKLFQEKGDVSTKAFCREHGIQPSQIRKWNRDIVRLKNFVDRSSVTTFA